MTNQSIGSYGLIHHRDTSATAATGFDGPCVGTFFDPSPKVGSENLDFNKSKQTLTTSGLLKASNTNRNPNFRITMAIRRGIEHATAREQNLRRLLDAALSVEETAVATDEGRQMAMRMPLAHSRIIGLISPMIESDLIVPDRAFHIDASDHSHDCHQCDLGTENDVFTYAGPFRYNRSDSSDYNDIGILFEPILESERDGVIATPFDSGGVSKYFQPQLSRAQQIEFMLAHELPVPSFRLLLGRYLTHCFHRPSSYFNNDVPKFWPIPMEGGDERGRTFEVRFPGEISLKANILAVFYPPSIQEFGVDLFAKIANWRANQITMILYPQKRGFDALQKACIAFLNGHFGT